MSKNLSPSVDEQDTLKQPRILVVEDDPVNQKILTRILKNEGYCVIQATTGATALELLQVQDITRKIDLVLLDIILPDYSGFQILEVIRRQASTKLLPVIFATAMDDRDSKVKGFALGAMDYISKPYEPLEILARVRIHIQLRKSMIELEELQALTLKQIYEAQRALLLQPSDMPQGHFRVHYQSLHAAGGDFYEVVPFDAYRTGYFIGDLAGHNVEIGFLTASIKALLKQNCIHIDNPLQSMRVMNNTLVKLFKPGQYLSASYVVVDRLTGQITYINMGHLPLIYLPRSGTAKYIEAEGDLLGAFKQAHFGLVQFTAEPGDQLVLYTDGLIEEAEHSIWTSSLNGLLESVSQISDSGFNHFPQRIYNLFFDDNHVPQDDILVFSTIFRPSVDYTQWGTESKLNLYLTTTEAHVTKAVQSLECFIVHKCLSVDPYGLSVCLHETLGNARRHGNHADPNLYIYASAEITSTELVIIIHDEGEGFNYLQNPYACLASQFIESGDLPPPPDENATSGRGFYLMRAYGFIPHFNLQGNQLTLTYTFPPND